MKVKIIVGISVLLFVIIVSSIGVAGLVLYEQKKSADLGQKIAATNSAVTDNNPSVQADSQLGGITVDIVANHSSRDDCWMIIEGNVYDFTKFLDLHPGSAASMLPYCGKDATSAFNTKDKNPPSAHSQFARDLLNQYYLGKLGSNFSATITPSQNMVTVSPTFTPTFAGRPTTAPASGTGSNNILTTQSVSLHSTPSDCWIIISGNVYAVSSYLNAHPGGAGAITPYCGRDATNAFNTKDKNPPSAHSSFAASQLNSYLIGRIGSTASVVPTNIPTNAQAPTSSPQNATPTPSSTPGGGGQNITLTMAQVSSHNTLQDCWMVISNKVYNLTAYISRHPGGQQAILDYCGRDGTTAFDTRGGRGTHSNNARNLLAGYYIGDLGQSVPTNTTPTPTPTTTTMPTGSQSQIPAVVLQRYPDAVLNGEMKYEDDGRLEFKIITNGQCRKIKINSAGEITEDKKC